MKKQTGSHIWVLLAIGLIIRLIAYFRGDGTDVVGVLALAADLGIGYIIYYLAKRNKSSRSLVYAALWLLNPAVIYISSVQGVFEPVLALLAILLMVFFRSKLYGVAAVVILPAVYQLRSWVVGSHYTSQGALNFYALFGGLNMPLTQHHMGISFTVWTAVFILLIVGFAAVAIFADYQAGGHNYYLIIGAYFILLFVFSSGMQAWGMLPGLAFLFGRETVKPGCVVVSFVFACAVYKYPRLAALLCAQRPFDFCQRVKHRTWDCIGRYGCKFLLAKA